VVAWLDAVRIESRINVVDASFTAQDAPGVVNASADAAPGAR
jgi:general secretion pathway protein M